MMSSPAISPPITPDELLSLPEANGYELVDGRLVERNMGSEASWIGGRVFHLLCGFCESQSCGWVLPADAGYQCFAEDPNRVRKPDVSFIRFGRLENERLPEGFFRLPPDLAVEVISPRDPFVAVEGKAEEYLDAGVAVVWVVNPRSRTVSVYRHDGSIARLHETDEIHGEGPLQGFSCRVGDFFPPTSAEP